MPYVRDLSGNNPAAGNNAGGVGVGLERPYCTYNRTGAGSPNAGGTQITPLYLGEIYWDSTNFVRFKATALTNTGWRPMEAEVT